MNELPTGRVVTPLLRYSGSGVPANPSAPASLSLPSAPRASSDTYTSTLRLISTTSPTSSFSAFRTASFSGTM